MTASPRLARVTAWAGIRKGEIVWLPRLSVARSTGLVGTRLGKGVICGSAAGLALVRTMANVKALMIGVGCILICVLLKNGNESRKYIGS